MPLAAYLTPPEFARQLRVKASKVIGWIRSGELAAIDTAPRGALRPRYRISREAVESFERRRAVVPLPAPVRRRRKRAAVKSFV
jgi:excisionase family DNA binding protein